MNTPSSVNRVNKNAAGKNAASNEALARAAKNMDWQQVVFNGGPPCFHLQEDGRFCGRAARWDGHPDMHGYVSLDALILSVIDKATKPLQKTIGTLEDQLCKADDLIAESRAAQPQEDDFPPSLVGWKFEPTSDHSACYPTRHGSWDSPKLPLVLDWETYLTPPAQPQSDENEYFRRKTLPAQPQEWTPEMVRQIVGGFLDGRMIIKLIAAHNASIATVRMESWPRHNQP